ncbi:hypothetical protein [Singulisphaera sp. PoT]|uniref:hypothetical protein n=1 Tax=Singulisphaera sp. PoT TaxID=3411797 RepID=UPI003BF45EC4
MATQHTIPPLGSWQAPPRPTEAEIEDALYRAARRGRSDTARRLARVLGRRGILVCSSAEEGRR